jgi:hypothetical protein
MLAGPGSEPAEDGRDEDHECGGALQGVSDCLRPFNSGSGVHRPCRQPGRSTMGGRNVARAANNVKEYRFVRD